MHTLDELKDLENKEFRDSYTESHVKSYVAHQIRAIRESRGMTQGEFSTVVGKPQSVVSRLEDTEYGKLAVQTLLDIAQKLDVSVIVKLASFEDFLAAYDDLSSKALAVPDYATEMTDKSSKMSIGATTAIPVQLTAQQGSSFSSVDWCSP